jgi:hypothetical protein
LEKKPSVFLLRETTESLDILSIPYNADVLKMATATKAFTTTLPHLERRPFDVLMLPTW